MRSAAITPSGRSPCAWFWDVAAAFPSMPAGPGIMDADDRSKAGPPTEPNFGRFKAPKCVYCNSTDDAEGFVAKDGPVLPGCVERVPNLNTAGRRHATLALHLHADQRRSTIALTPAVI